MATDIRSDTHTKGLLRTQDREIYLTIHSTNRLTSVPSAGCGIRTHNPRKQAAEDPHLRPRTQRHRPVFTLEAYVYTNFDRPSWYQITQYLYLRVCCLSAARVLHRTFVVTSLLACSSSSVDLISASSFTNVCDGFASYLYTCTDFNLHINGTQTHLRMDPRGLFFIKAQTYGHRNNYEPTAQFRPQIICLDRYEHKC